MRYKPKECTKNYLKNICDEISKLSSVLEWDIIDEVLQVIHNSKKIVFFKTISYILYLYIFKLIY